MTSSRVGAHVSLPGPINPLLEGPGEYPFVRLERRSRELIPAGVTPIDFSIGDPRERTPAFIRDALRAAVPEVSSYPTVAGVPELRRAAAGWAQRRFGITLDPDTELLPVNGTKEAVFLLAFAVIGREAEKNLVVIPTPAYPVYAPAARLAGGEPHFVPLRSADGWKFRLDSVPDEIWRRTALLWLNSPHNPTGSMLELNELSAIGAHARQFGYWVGADEAYAEVFFGDARPHSMLECGLENVLAFHTLSKRSAMTGYRSGFMAGDARLIHALRRLRPNVGVATPEFVQRAAIVAWNDDAHAAAQRDVYRTKRDVMLAAFTAKGWHVEASVAAFYLWMRVPDGDDTAFVERLLRAGLVAMPGSWFDPAGAGYVRWALVPTLEQCREALERISHIA